jgi:hypothetical protein
VVKIWLVGLVCWALFNCYSGLRCCSCLALLVQKD